MFSLFLSRVGLSIDLDTSKEIAAILDYSVQLLDSGASWLLETSYFR